MVAYPNSAYNLTSHTVKPFHTGTPGKQLDISKSQNIRNKPHHLNWGVVVPNLSRVTMNQVDYICSAINWSK